MKKIIILFLLIGTVFTSCNNDDDFVIAEEEQSENFNSQEIDELLITIQDKLPQFVENAGKISASLTRIKHMFGGGSTGAGADHGNYIETFDSESGWNNNIWNIAYSEMLPKIDEAILIAEEEGYNKHSGIAKIIKAYTVISLVDMYSDVLYASAGESYDLTDGDVIYNNALNLLEEAILDLNLSGEDLETDYYYNNDFSKWIKLANTLKMAAYLNTRLVDASAIDKFNEIVASNNYINSVSDDFEFRYGANASEENTIHPNYEKDYAVTGAGMYRSNWLMDRMQKDNDPRIRYYFYRQISCMPGNIGVDGTLCEEQPWATLCNNNEFPSHYTQEMAFCSLEKGYWGRDHGNSDGIPPDGFKRTVSGVYPAAGKFDGSNFEPVAENLGGQGIGITPILLSSWVSFMQAEVALQENDVATANSLLQEGIQKSIDKAMSFGSLDPEINPDYIPSGAEVSEFLTSISESFTNANTNDKWDILARQQFVSHYGNGLDSYNMYRRTGYPYTLQYFLNPNPGAFIRSLLYPDTALEGGQVTQKPNVEVQVFWDTNNSYPAFPYSN